MNILFLSGYSINPQDGGIARITHTLANMFNERGHNIWYLGYRKVSDDDSNRQLYFPIGKPIAIKENIDYLENIIDTKNIDIVIVQKTPCRDYIKMLAACKKKHNFLIVSCFHNLILRHIYNYAYVVENKLKKKKLSLFFNILKNRWINHLLVKFYIAKNRSLYKYVVDNSDVSLVLCEGHKEELLTMIGEKSNESIRIMPNCCNENNINKREKANEVIWVGRVDCDVKRIDYMMDIWDRIQNKHPNWSLIILGDGPSLSDMKKRAQINNNKNVRFEGRVIPDSYYDKAKIICVTSTFESFSLVTIEAKMHGVVPVVQNSFPIAREIVNNSVDGVLVKPFDIDEFSKQLDILMSNEDLINCYSQKAIESSQQYSPNRILSLWENLFHAYALHNCIKA